MKLARVPERARELEVVYLKSNDRGKSGGIPAKGFSPISRKANIPGEPKIHTSKITPGIPANEKYQAKIVKESNNHLSAMVMEPSAKLVPDLLSKDIKETAVYADYFRVLREKVRRSLGRPARIEEGEVHLVFTVFSSGELKGDSLKILKDSYSSAYLRALASYAVEKASPFPPFPPGLSSPSINFNLTVSFEVNK
ncbi:MAG: TonB C-terminal domain-containing protein [Candidatus Omnitrophica bacterium]|nr:TonB C-terminal domain-containing protein [Candidatus Omnitrophota bacterium]